MTADWREDRIGSALRGENPDRAATPGLRLCRHRRPAVPAGLLRAAGRRPGSRPLDPAFRRINLEILGNTDPFLHAHVWPRYEWEPPEIVGAPVWHHPRDRWGDPETALGPQHEDLRRRLTNELDRLATAQD